MADRRPVTVTYSHLQTVLQHYLSQLFTSLDFKKKLYQNKHCKSVSKDTWISISRIIPSILRNWMRFNSIALYIYRNRQGWNLQDPFMDWSNFSFVFFVRCRFLPTQHESPKKVNGSKKWCQCMMLIIEENIYFVNVNAFISNQLFL